MAGGDDDYADAFKKAKLEHDQQLEAPTEAKRLQAEADADIAVLSNVVLPQLQAAAQKLHPLGGKVLRTTARVTFWGALALALTAGIGKLFGTVV